MFDVKFYYFNKRHNSSKRPTSSTPSATFSCTMKSPTSITAPAIELRISQGSIPDFNYCYIADFGERYYFIERTYYDTGVWVFQLSCDVLATYYNDILASSQFVVRSASHYDSSLVDTLYPSTPGGCRVSRYSGCMLNGVFTAGAVKGYRPTGTTITIQNYFTKPILSGNYILGIKGDNSTGVTYYAVNATVFQQLITGAFNIHPSMSSDTTDAFANAVYDPLQYLVSCRWYPYAFEHSSQASTTQSIKLGNRSINIEPNTAQLLTGQAFTIEWECLIEIPRHPDASSYAYLNQSPYSQYNLYMQPFGYIPVDSTRIYGYPAISVRWNVDYLTGTCAMKISSARSDGAGGYIDNDDAFFINTYEYGVEIPISALVTDWKTGAIISGLSWIADKFPSFNLNLPSITKEGEGGGGGHSFGSSGLSSMFEPAADKSSGLLGKVIDALGSSMGQVQSVGGVGSFLAYSGTMPALYNHYLLQQYHDDDRFGRPLYQKTNMALCDGFTLCMDASVNYTNKQPLPVESTAVADYLNSGMFME